MREEIPDEAKRLALELRDCMRDAGFGYLSAYWFANSEWGVRLTGAVGLGVEGDCFVTYAERFDDEAD